MPRWTGGAAQAIVEQPLADDMMRLALLYALAALIAPALAFGQPASTAPARLTDAELSKAVAGRLAEMGEDYSGVVLVARRGRPIVAIAQGWADRERGIPNTLKTKFRVGSMNKMHTAVAVLQLAQAGKVDLNAPLITYLKDYPNAAWARKVTLHQLLTHTGGAGDIFGPAFDARRDQLRSLQDYVALYGGRAATFEPGAENDYSNYGFILLGRVIEVVSGQTYPDYLQEHVFAAAGMTDTGFEPESLPVTGRAVAYEKTETGVRPVDGLPWRGTSAGGGYSTAPDFLKFAIALHDGGLLDETHRKLLLTPWQDLGDGMHYGYGFALYPGPSPIPGHNGVADGMNGDLRIIDGGEGVIVTLTNVAPPFLAGKLGKFVSDRFTAR
ncbi:serine hydrolase domain-containing protein [Caulobacter segnis]|uniref:serine hydrolase domain-containing protein n=1 Tax=Caulobacter segnis TaxID=88688 RepID=UPI00285FD98F|nr:serine hydrolase domain-containing protein [Caulobacter segnis]MDR6626943.1 CubicO group peptidase (beta-lactamase class C family) [Caulobacter segnis]